MKFLLREEAKKEFDYTFDLNVSFEVECDASDGTDVTDVFFDEIWDAKHTLISRVTTKLDKVLREKNIGINEVNYDDDDLNLDDTGVAYCTVTTDREYDVESISKILKEGLATTISDSEELEDLVYSGDELPHDRMEPPEYSDEYANITVTIYVDDVTNVKARS